MDNFENEKRIKKPWEPTQIKGPDVRELNYLRIKPFNRDKTRLIEMMRNDRLVSERAHDRMLLPTDFQTAIYRRYNLAVRIVELEDKMDSMEASKQNGDDNLEYQQLKTEWNNLLDEYAEADDLYTDFMTNEELADQYNNLLKKEIEHSKILSPINPRDN